MTGRLEVLGDDGEWHQVPGVASVEIDMKLEPQQTPIQIYIENGQVIREAYATLAGAYAAAARPIVIEVARRLEAVGSSLRAGRLIDQDGKPVRQPDRPAWQSPYGPPSPR
ncbi:MULTISPECIES: hypothetical protein [Streptomyces]|uniref:hypothetical protein n=1 Tax=Streptomyces TaxID=1883 RepID=UPI0006E3CE03|nr:MULTISPECIES: hypothetical protein [Streptomyces]MCL6734403.1 hypothetical protein [Streptomyces neyagawaensis]MDE1682032.1 hypothetical protein [Streptomyces neyagawaensis]